MTEKFDHSMYDQLTPTQIGECITFLEQVLQLSRLPKLDTEGVNSLKDDLQYLRNLMLQKIEEEQFTQYNSRENWKN